MATHGDFESISILAGADLSGSQYRAVQIAGTLATTNVNAAGILQNKPQSGENACIAYSGHMKGIAGAALAAGARFKVASGGFLAAVASGDTSHGFVVTAASSGAVCEIIGDFLNYTYTYSAG